jgi:N-acetylmuramoyl-L-alanine amidase
MMATQRTPAPGRPRAWRPHARRAAIALAWLSGFAASIAGAEEAAVGKPLERQGDELVACGKFFHTTTPVVLWMDPGGYDAYRPERRFVAPEEASWEKTQAAGIKTPSRYGSRTRLLKPEAAEQVREKGWDLPKLQEVVDQFVIHFDVAGTSRKCFDVLHDHRGLSVHFMLDLDGTIYQTLDLKESAWHATKANSRSIGIEIANMGAYGKSGRDPFANWYRRGDDGKTVLTVPGGTKGLRLPDALLRPDRDEPVVGTIHGQELRQYDFTPQQYEALTKLTAALCTVFPKIMCDYPRDADGALTTRTLPEAEYDRYQGVLGHYHVQTNKTDPGPAFQWDRVIGGAKKLMR